MQIPGYTVIAPLGRGGQASVFHARSDAGVDVALKLFPRPRNRNQAGRFRREADSLRAIKHPGVVAVLDHGFVNEQPYVILELIDGRPLSEAIARGISLETVLDIARQLAEALRAVHQAGITHRDVKPENVLLAGERVVLVDFGLAHLAADGSHSLTKSGALLGTPTYLAPELATGDLRAVGPAADVYSWAVTVFEAVCGRTPFTAESLVGLLRKVAEDRPPSLRSMRPDTPPWLSTLIAACLAKAPGSRPRDGAALVRALQRAERGRPTSKPRATGWIGALAGVLLGVGVWTVWSGAGASSDPPTESHGEPAASTAVATRHTVEIRLDPLSGKDTFVDASGWYTNDNYGADRVLSVGLRRRGGQTAPRQLYLQFPLERIPPGAELESATLELVAYAKREESLALVAHRVLEPWIEGANGLDDSLDGVAWGPGPQPIRDPKFTRPQLDGAQLSAASPLSAGGPLSWDVTEAALVWLEDRSANFGLSLVPVHPGGELEEGFRYMTFHSRDTKLPSQRPCLRVTYVGAAPAPEGDSFATRLAKHRTQTAEALRQATRLLPRERLRRVNELLGAMPSDPDLRCARTRAHIEVGDLESAINDCESFKRIHQAPFPPAAMEAAAAILREPGLGASVTTSDKLWIVWETYWQLSQRELAPATVLPGREFRVGVIQQRIATYGRLDTIVATYRRGLELWPKNPQLLEELNALPDFCLQIARTLREQPGRGQQRSRAIAVEALQSLPCTPDQLNELQDLASGR